MTDHWFFWVFLTLYTIHQIWESVLVRLNHRYIRRHAQGPPPYFQDQIPTDLYQRGIRYNLEKGRFGLLTQWVSIPIVWAVILSGGFAQLDTWVGQWAPTPLAQSVLYCFIVGVLIMLLNIPASWYTNFSIEKKYGFNRMTAGTFISDLVKAVVLSTLVGLPLLTLLFWLYAQAGSLWWLWAFLSIFGFQFLMAALYPTLIAPIFNKFTPLPEGSLKEAIIALAKKIHFKLSGIYTIDGSKRSSHSNAYFAGLGRLRRIVLFDTLVEQMTEPEIVSVLCHEMGHNKKRHIHKGLLISFIFTGFGFWLLSYLVRWEPLFTAFNAGPPAPHKAFVLFALFSSHFIFPVQALTNMMSRKFEYEADAFSASVTQDKGSMISGLIKLSKENLSNLTPHPLYSFYHYSHPTAHERIKALEK